jgi:hypothetical protein
MTDTVSGAASTNPDADPVIKCWTCKGATRLVRGDDKKNVFVICDKCNPEGTIEELIEGCNVLCQICFESIAYDNNQYTPCDECGKLMCEACSIHSDWSVDIKETNEWRNHCCQQCYELWYSKQ